MSTHILLTQDCNFKCKYCFVSHQPRFMTRTTARKAVEFLTNPEIMSDKVNIEWFGGEPLLMANLLLETTDYAYELAKINNIKLSVGIVSNMSLLTPELAKEIKKRNIGILASYDGKFTHDHTRHPGTSKLIYDNIKLAMDTGIRMGIAMQAVPGHIHNLFENFLDVASLGTSWMAINPVMSNYTKMTDNDWAELDKQFTLISDYIYETKMKAGYGNKTFEWAQMAKQLEAILNVARFGPGPANKDWSCGACKGSIAIDPEGYIVPCHHMPTDIGYDKWILGHVFEGKINTEIRAEFTKTQFEDCSECAVIRCAPCRTMNKTVTGSEFERNPDACTYQRLIFTHAVMLHNRLTDSGYYEILTRPQHPIMPQIQDRDISDTASEPQAIRGN